MAFRFGGLSLDSVLKDMNHDEQEEIRKLLRLKRHEVPPPGYFRDFSSGVMARIRREEATKPLPWWRRQTLPWSPSARLAWSNALTLVGLGVVAFSLYITSVTGPQGNPPLISTQPQLGGLGLGLEPRGSLVPNTSLLSMESPIEIRVIPIRTAMPADTNPFPQGLFQLPENPSVRVGFGPNR
jgi:hypothetical protein